MASDLDCNHVRTLNYTDQCGFVMNNTECQDVDGYLNYVEILYCQFGGEPQMAIAAMLVFLIWLCILFTGLAISADDYFCPNLASISKTLRLSHNIAGVTILAFGNGSPDIFSALAAVNQSRPELVLGALFGAGVFVTTAVAGAVCLSTPFELMQRPFLRDVVFYIAAGFWAFCIFYRGKIYLFDSIGFLVLYVVYISVVIIGRIINQKIRQKQQQVDEAALIDNNVTVTEEVPDAVSTIFVPRTMGPNYQSWVDPTTQSINSSTHSINSNQLDTVDAAAGPSLNNDNVSVVSVSPRSGSSSLSSSSTSELALNWRHFMTKINPFVDWFQIQNSKYIPGYIKKIWLIIKSPVILIFCTTIPVVDIEEEGGQQAWCQILHGIQLILGSQFLAFVLPTMFGLSGNITVIDFQLWQLVLVISLLLVVGLLCTSKPQKAPFYQPILAFIGFVVAIAWIYVIANEIVSILKAFGVYFGLSDAILGLTILAWGNSIGDLVADVAISKQGYPRMGFSACFGGPLFNLLLGIGLPFTIALIKSEEGFIEVQFDPMVLVLSASLGVALLINLVVWPLTKFRATKKHGIVLCALYVILLAIALGVEFTT